MVEVLLASALICFDGNCYPALVGPKTKEGEFQLIQRLTQSAGYGGDVLQFYETEHSVQAIHRVWTLKPSQRRVERLQSSDPSQRRTITNGCVNVMPDVYDKLLQCCSSSKVRILNK